MPSTRTVESGPGLRAPTTTRADGAAGRKLRAPRHFVEGRAREILGHVAHAGDSLQGVLVQSDEEVEGVEAGRETGVEKIPVRLHADLMPGEERRHRLELVPHVVDVHRLEPRSCAEEVPALPHQARWVTSPARRGGRVRAPSPPPDGERRAPRPALRRGLGTSVRPQGPCARKAQVLARPGRAR